MSDRLKAAFVGAVSGIAGVTKVAAQEDIAAAGNGGTADASANGGAVALGDVNSGGNAGNAISVGDTGGFGELICDKYGKCYESAGSSGSVSVDGGAVANSTTIDISADGGTAIADASGGDYNIAFLS
ncbi:MAG: hypothetical protein M3464_21830 [Chloroflexota bacterium]|nr:hypothetical protein [Chloroflexota bacterium]